MIVIAAPGIQVPHEEKPRTFITETPPEGAKGFEVPETAYYLRRIADGDLLRADQAVAAEEAPTAVVADAQPAAPVTSKKAGSK